MSKIMAEGKFQICCCLKFWKANAFSWVDWMQLFAECRSGMCKQVLFFKRYYSVAIKRLLQSLES